MRKSFERIQRYLYRLSLIKKKQILKFLLPSEDRKFLDFMCENQTISSSQIGQDIIPFFLAGEVFSGYFVEVGAADGITLSNSLSLEKNFGWQGILIEPSRSYLSDLKANRTALIINQAVSGSPGEVEFEEREDGLYSSLSGFGGRSKAVDRRYNVESLTLTQILERCKAPKVIDLMTIDTEGNEFDVIAGISFSRWYIKVICVEHNYNFAKLTAIDSILSQNSFKRILPIASQFDAFYANTQYLTELNAE